MKTFTNLALIFIAIFGLLFLVGTAGSYELGKIELKDFFVRAVIGLACLGFPLFISKLEEWIYG